MMFRPQPLVATIGSILVLSFLCSASFGEGLVNPDFSDNTLTDAGSGAAWVKYGDLDQGWVAKEAGALNNWEIVGGKLTQPNRKGSETRVAQFFTNNMTGTDWVLKLALGGGTISDNINVWGGVDDGNNTATTNMMKLGGDGPPVAGTGTWTQIVDLDDIPNGQISEPISADLGDFDIIGIMISSQRNGPSGLTVDDVEFFNPNAVAVPEPHSIAIWSLFGLCLAGYGYRRGRKSAS